VGHYNSTPSFIPATGIRQNTHTKVHPINQKKNWLTNIFDFACKVGVEMRPVSADDSFHGDGVGIWSRRISQFSSWSSRQPRDEDSESGGGSGDLSEMEATSLLSRRSDGSDCESRGSGLLRGENVTRSFVTLCDTGAVNIHSPQVPH